MHVSQAAMRALMAYSWPGNVRQLENAIERAVALGAGRNEIDIADLPPEIQALPQAAATPFVDFPEDGLDLPAYLSSIERDLIQTVARAHAVAIATRPPNCSASSGRRWSKN